jgi:hypothetical protein
VFTDLDLEILRCRHWSSPPRVSQQRRGGAGRLRGPSRGPGADQQ